MRLSFIGSAVKNLPANAGDTGSIPESGRASGEGNGNLYFCLGNPWTEEPGNYSWWGYKRVRHNLATIKQQK